MDVKRNAAQHEEASARERFAHSINRENVVCPYCERPAGNVGGRALYPYRHDLYEKRFWYCKRCQAWVGCHAGSVKPLGRLANAALRAAKQRAHAALDPLWKSGRMDRREAYSKLASRMKLSGTECHIGLFDEEQCERVVFIAKALDTECEAE
jgi:hypothetical protein